ncbi:hypothetical protein K438DRAFT_1777398 [Mycena galopus ATCC 62051]|nr:hypothetical protein K438DRAFT_1777398 [Mycena galopus ATCC 62051]
MPWHPAIPDFGSGLERSSYTLDIRRYLLPGSEALSTASDDTVLDHSTTCGFRSSALGRGCLYCASTLDTTIFAQRLRRSHARVSNMTLGKEQDEWKGEEMNEQPIKEHGEHEIVDWFVAGRARFKSMKEPMASGYLVPIQTGSLHTKEVRTSCKEAVFSGARLSVGLQQMRQKPKLEVVADLSNNAHELSASSSQNIAAKDLGTSYRETTKGSWWRGLRLAEGKFKEDLTPIKQYHLHVHLQWHWHQHPAPYGRMEVTLKQRYEDVGTRYCVRDFLASKVQYWYKGKCGGEQTVSVSGMLIAQLGHLVAPYPPPVCSSVRIQSKPTLLQFRKLGQSLPPSTRSLNTRFASHAAHWAGRPASASTTDSLLLHNRTAHDHSSTPGAVSMAHPYPYSTAAPPPSFTAPSVHIPTFGTPEQSRNIVSERKGNRKWGVWSIVLCGSGRASKPGLGSGLSGSGLQKIPSPTRLPGSGLGRVGLGLRPGLERCIFQQIVPDTQSVHFLLALAAVLLLGFIGQCGLIGRARQVQKKEITAQRRLHEQ